MEPINESQSSCNVFPRGNNVLVQISFTTSTLAVSTGNYKGQDDEDVEFIIAGFGPLVKDLKLGDHIIMDLSEYKSVPVKENKSSIVELKKTYDSMSKEELTRLIHNKDTNRVKIIEYGIFPEFLIKANDR